MEQKKVLAQKVRLPQGWVGIPTWAPLCRSFLHDVTAAILGYKTIKRRLWCYFEKLLWALIYVPVQILSLSREIGIIIVLGHKSGRRDVIWKRFYVFHSR